MTASSTCAADTAGASSTAAGSKSLPARLVGVLFSPRATYADVAARPRVLGALVFVILVGAGGIYTLLSTEKGQNMMVDQQVQQRESFGRPVTDEQLAQIERFA